MKNMFQSTPPLLQLFAKTKKVDQIGPEPKYGAIFQYIKIAIMYVGHILMNLCSKAPK